MPIINNTCIVAPVAVSDVANMFGLLARKIGYLCSDLHGRTNKWSRFKPIDNEAIFPDRSGKWWREGRNVAGYKHSCGLLVTSCKDPNNIPDLYPDLGACDWEYRRPTSPYPICSFANYKHDAQPPVPYITCPEKGCGGKMFKVSRPNVIDNPTGPASLTLEDILGDGPLYFGVMIVPPSATGQKLWITASQNNPREVNFDWPHSTLGVEYTILPFISTVARNSFDGLISNATFYPLPLITPPKVSTVGILEYYGIALRIQAEWPSGSQSVQVSVNITKENAEVNATVTGYVRIAYRTADQIGEDSNKLFRNYASKSIPFSDSDPVAIGSTAVTAAVEYNLTFKSTSPQWEFNVNGRSAVLSPGGDNVDERVEKAS